MSAFTIGKFQVVEPLGKGAHSTIMHVRRAADSTHYALKVVVIGGADEQKFLDQAEHEFRVAQMLDHPNLIKIYALETARDWLFRPRKLHLLIEYVNGKTLDTYHHIAIPKLLQIFVQVAAGLVHMHRRGVCHADLKPNNILLSRSGEVKIIDYGLAWIKGENKQRVQGTPEYMAPEQARQRIANERTDIYNFGATMYRLVTLRHPPSMVVKNGQPLRLGQPSNMHNQRVEARPALCREDLRDGAFVGCIATKPIDGLSRESDEPPGFNEFRRPVDRPRSGGRDQGNSCSPVSASSTRIALTGQLSAASRIFSTLSPAGSTASD